MSAFALNICAYRKPGMDEGEYHKYISEKHAPSLKELLAQNKIVDYTMQHNTTEAQKMLTEIYGDMPAGMVADHDAYIQIVFNDIQDYLKVKNDPHYQQVVAPDHANFSDPSRTKMSTGWFERHVANGQVV